MIIQKAKITAKRQITIPIRIMRKLGLHPGDNITFKEDKEHIEILPAAEKFSALDIIGKYPELSVRKISSEDIRQIREKMFLEKAKKYK